MENSMNSDFIFTSVRLGFRFWKENDLELAELLWCDPEVTRLFHKTGLSREQVKLRLASEISI